MHNRASDQDSLSSLQRRGRSSPARSSPPPISTRQGSGTRRLFPSRPELGEGGVIQGESGGGSVISVNAGTDRERDVVVEEVAFEDGPMFQSNTGAAVRGYRDTASLLLEEAEDPDNEVLAFLWNARTSGCGASVGARGKFCTATNCRVAAHRNAPCVPDSGNWYIPATNKASWGLALPTLVDAELSEEIREALEVPRNPVTLKAVFNEIKAGIDNGVADSLTLQAVKNTSAFDKTYRETMAHTPGKALIHAANFRRDQETAIQATEDLIAHFAVPEDTSMEFADAPSTPVRSFDQVQHALGALENRMKIAEEAIGKSAVGLFDALNNYESLSNVVAGSYKSLEASIGNNIDTDAFMSVWEGVQYVKDAVTDLDTRFKGMQVLHRDRFTRITEDNTALMNRVAAATSATTRVETRLNQGRLGPSDTVNSLVPDFLPASIDGAVHPLFYHVAFGVDHFFNKLDFNIDKYSDRFDELAAKGVGEKDPDGCKEEIAALKEQVEKLTGMVKKMQSPDHGRAVQIGTHIFHGQDDVLELLTRLNDLEPLPLTFWGLCYDMWHFSDRLAGIDGVQKTESEVADEQYKMSRLKQSSSQMRIRAGIKRFAPILFEPAGTGRSQETKQPFTSLKKSTHWYSAATQSGRWFHARPNVTSLHEQIQFEIEDLLGCDEHKPLRDLLKEMCADAKNHLHAATQWMSNTMEQESQACHSGNDAAWFYVTTAMTGFLKELRKERYCVLDEESPDLTRNLQLGAKVIWAFGKARMCMQEITDAQFVSHRICVAATGRYMNLSRATKASVSALDHRVEEELKKIRKLINKKE